MEVKEIKLNLIEVDKNQPRKKFEDIGELASNILKEGLLEPLKVVKDGKKYLLVDGERRFRALKLLEKSSGGDENIARCIILKKPTHLKITQLCTDLHKRKLDPFEEADAFKELIESGLDINDLVGRLGKARTYIVRRLKLLNFSPYTRKLIDEKRLPMSMVDKIDIDTMKEKEPQIISRILDEKPRNVEEIKKIVDEETHRYEYRINTFLNELENFKKEVSNFYYYIKGDIDDAKLDDAKLDDAKLDDAIKEINRFLYNLQKFEKIKEESEDIKKKLEKLCEKFGKRHIIKKEELA